MAQTKSYELTPTPVSHLPVTLVEERRWQKSQEQRVELSLGKKKELGAFIFVSVSRSAFLKIPKFNSQQIKLIFPKLSLVYL